MTAKSGYIGVYAFNRRGWWQVKVFHNGRRYSFGVYRDRQYAAKLYDAIVLQLKGGAYKLNFGGKWPEEFLRSEIAAMLSERGLA